MHKARGVLLYDSPEHLHHRAGLVLVGDVNVGFHGLVAGVACPLHDGLGVDAGGECGADEGAAGGMGGEALPFRDGLLMSLPSGEPHSGHRCIDPAHFAELLDMDIDRRHGDIVFN